MQSRQRKSDAVQTYSVAGTAAAAARRYTERWVTELRQHVHAVCVGYYSRGGSIYRKYRRYIDDIVITVSVWYIGTLDIGFSIYRYGISDMWKYRISNFSIFCHTFSHLPFIFMLTFSFIFSFSFTFTFITSFTGFPDIHHHHQLSPFPQISDLTKNSKNYISKPEVEFDIIKKAVFISSLASTKLVIKCASSDTGSGWSRKSGTPPETLSLHLTLLQMITFIWLLLSLEFGALWRLKLFKKILTLSFLQWAIV